MRKASGSNAESVMHVLVFVDIGSGAHVRALIVVTVLEVVVAYEYKGSPLRLRGNGAINFSSTQSQRSHESCASHGYGYYRYLRGSPTTGCGSYVIKRGALMPP